MKDLITMTEVTAEQVINSSAKEYNPRVWTERVLSYNKREGAEFFKDSEEDETFYVKYKIAEGLVLFSEINYHSCLHNGGFTQMLIVYGKYVTPEGLADLNQIPRLKTLTASNAVAYKYGFGKEGKQRVTNSKEGRAWLVNNICKHGVAVTND
jgi:hypothetical protein